MLGKKHIFSLFLSMTLLLSGCSIQLDVAEKSTMTEKEKELLSRIYADTDRIQKGQLFSYQKEALMELQAGMQYLAEKYPESDLQILTFEPATKFSQVATALLQDQEGKNYLLTIMPEDDGRYSCRDTYYGALLREAYDKRIGEALADSGISALVFTEFPTPMGFEINEQTSVDTLMDIKSELARNTSIFIGIPADKEETAAEIKACLVNANLYGVYMLYFVPFTQSVDAADLQEQRSSFEKKVFQCFD